APPSRCRGASAGTDPPPRRARTTMRTISATARMPSSTQTQAGVPLLELDADVVVPDVGTTTLRVVVRSTVAVVVCWTVAVVIVVCSTVVVAPAARPPAAIAPARRAPAAKRAAKAASFIAVGAIARVRAFGMDSPLAGCYGLLTIAE